MTPREVIVSYLAVLNQMQHQIDLEYDKMAGALVDRLSDAGFVIVPRKATQAMLKAIQPGYASEYASAESHWDAMIAEATKP